MFKAILIMVVMGANGQFEANMETIEGDNADRAFNAYNKCLQKGDDWIYDDPENNLAFKCVYIPREKKL